MERVFQKHVAARFKVGTGPTMRHEKRYGDAAMPVCVQCGAELATVGRGRPSRFCGTRAGVPPPPPARTEEDFARQAGPMGRRRLGVDGRRRRQATAGSGDGREPHR